MTPEEVKQYDERRGAAHIYHTSGVLLQSATTILSPALLKKGAPTDIRTSLISVILLYAISAEVALKAMLIKEGQGCPNSHDLKVMFDSLSEATKEEIKNKVIFRDFDAELENIRKSFVDWRYFYEGGSKSINIDFLRKFSEVVNDLTLK